jgi:hypothetical protein
MSSEESAQASKSGKQGEPASSAVQRAITWASLAVAAAESICIAMVGLSGIRVLLGLSSLMAAGAGGPARGFHREAIRIPLLAIGATGALVSAFLLWNEERLRRNPASAWRVRPMTHSQKGDAGCSWDQLY